MITPYICLPDCRAAIDWYCRVFGARVTFEPIIMPDGRIGHAELTIGEDGRFMMSDSHPAHGAEPPQPGRGNAVTLHLVTAEVDQLVEAARAAGATIDRGPESGDHGRMATLHDPFGHRWMLNDQA